MSFEKRTVMITGAAGHLGRVVAASFAQQGARIILVDRHLVALEGELRDDVECASMAADLLDIEQCRSTIGAALQRFGAVDALCHLAGGFRMGEAVHETTDGTWNHLFDLNVKTFVNITRVVVPHMLERTGGKIVSVGAVSALRGAARMGAYCASKSSVVCLTESMSAELKEHNINVNCVLPTIIDTPDNRAALPDADPSRWVSPQALADVIVFLVSDAARAIHGAALPVAGLI